MIDDQPGKENLEHQKVAGKVISAQNPSQEMSLQYKKLESKRESRLKSQENKYLTSLLKKQKSHRAGERRNRVSQNFTLGII